MRQDPIPAAVADRLSVAARRLRAARRTALDRVAVEDTEWEYAGRTWSWPAGEARTYFHELAPGEREVLEDLIADLDDHRGANEPDAPRPESEPGAGVVGVGTGRVAVGIPGSIRGEVETTDEEVESTPGGPDATGDGSDVTGNGVDVTGNGVDVTGNAADATDAGSAAVAGDPLVAKLARYGPSAEMGDGRPQNRRERRIWSAIGSHPFLPVIDGDDAGDWIVMPRADVPPDEPIREEALERVRAALAPYRDRFHFDELKPENVGAYRGRFWVVDYGRPWGEPLFVEPPGESGSTEPTSVGDASTEPGPREAEAAGGSEERQDRSSEN